MICEIMAGILVILLLVFIFIAYNMERAGRISADKIDKFNEESY